jgi:hypothetical protein
MSHLVSCILSTAPLLPSGVDRRTFEKVPVFGPPMFFSEVGTKG